MLPIVKKKKKKKNAKNTQRVESHFKVARPSIFIGTPSIFESLILKQIDLYCKTIMTRITLRLNFISKIQLVVYN